MESATFHLRWYNSIMALYGIAREGIWIDHNGIRGPIVIESGGYPLGFPRSDFSQLDVIHDGDTFFICYLDGPEDFILEFLRAEPELTDFTLSGVLNKAIWYRGKSQRKKDICGEVRKLLQPHIDLRKKSPVLDEEFLNREVFNHKFVIYRPSKQEIAEKGLRP